MKNFKPIIVLFSLAFAAGCALPQTKQPSQESSAPETYEHSEKQPAPAETAANKAEPAPRKKATLDSALALLKANQHAAAEQTLLEVTNQNPGNATAWLNLGLIYARKQRLQEAENALNQAARLAPRSAVVFNELGILRRKLNRYAAAEQAYQRALELAPESAKAHRNIGILYDLHLRKPDQALQHYRRYAALNPQDRAVNLWIAQLENSKQ